MELDSGFPTVFVYSEDILSNNKMTSDVGQGSMLTSPMKLEKSIQLIPEVTLSGSKQLKENVLSSYKSHQ